MTMKTLEDLTELHLADTRRKAYMLGVVADCLNGSYFRQPEGATALA